MAAPAARQDCPRASSLIGSYTNVSEMSRARSPSKQLLPKRGSMPQNRCYRTGSRKGGPVTERARREYAAVLRARYATADRRGRGQILDEYCRTTGCHRKAAIRRLRKSVPVSARPPGRPQRYGAELVPVLARVWEASDYLCGTIPPPMLATLLTALERHHALALRSPIRAALLAASPATLDRLLRPLRRRRARQPRTLAPALTTIPAH